MTDADRVPLSPGQQALWLFQHMSPRSSAYHVPIAFRLTGPLAVDALRGALDMVVRRHEVLRTAFRVDGDGEPYQEVLPPGRVDVPVHEAADADAAFKVVEDLVRAPFDLAEGRPIRAAVVRPAEHEHVFVVVLHHIVADGWSLRVLTDELSSAYRALWRGEEPKLPHLDVQYADYALWQRELMSEMDDRIGYWARVLADLPAVDLAGGRPRPRRPSYTAERLLVDVPADVTRGLRALAAARGTSLFPLLAAAFAVVLRDRTGQADVAFGTLLAGRGEPELEPLVGYFVNLVVLRCDLSDDPSTTEVARRLGAAMLAAIDHEAPFGAVVERLAPPRAAGRNPLVQVTMQLRTGTSAPAVPDLPGVDAVELDVYQGQHAFDLTLTFLDLPDRLTVSAEYSTEVFDRAGARDLVDRIVRTLHALPEGNADGRPR
ncbi:MAG: hypothetical protein HOV94_19000 [Saccharothrix sp.]|nr:hypothetical protein [Saccharothrix sp.]